MSKAQKEYQRWWAMLPPQDEWRAELNAVGQDPAACQEAFGSELQFGTGGLRAEIGVGTNRMNHYVVRRATQGLAAWLQASHPTTPLAACIAYDTRRYSQAFAQQAAQVLCAAGITVYLFAEPRPTPMLSFAVRHFGAQAGIMITASHNPAEYNGYKAYGATGGQLTDEDTEAVLRAIAASDYFNAPPIAAVPGQLLALGAAFDESYYQAIGPALHRQAFTQAHGAELRILYTPLHGAGLVPVTQILARQGFTAVTVEPTQAQQDAACSFATVAKPNPEELAAFAPALQTAQQLQPDLIMATDPDADRIGVLAQEPGGAYTALSGTQLGALLCDYCIQTAREQGNLPPHPAVVTTVVTGTLAERICQANGVAVELVLTGFKYIGARMDEWHKSGEKQFLLGFEESFGYLVGQHSRDKDAVVTAALLAEMALHHKRQGKTLHAALRDLFAKYGPVCEAVHNVEAKGEAGAAQIAQWMQGLRAQAQSALPGEEVVALEDYSLGEHRDLRMGTARALTLPKSNVLKLYIADGSWLVLRPSGTEPKIKLYICTHTAFAPGDALSQAEARCQSLLQKATQIFR